jgi:tetratricopeptide (TPR) repeat protein
LKNTNGYAAAVNNLAANLFRRGEYRDALENMLRVLETLEKIGLDKTDNYATVMNNVGTCYVKLNQENRAAEYYRKSSGIYEKIGLNSTYGYARTIINLHSVLQNRGSGEASRREVERAMDILEKLKLQRTASYQLGKSMLAKMNRGSDSPNLLKNPGFEQGWAHWSRYWGKGRGKRKIDSSVKRSGRKSAKLKFYSNFGPHIYKTFSQRISGLKRNTKYRFECWVRGNGLKRKGALFATADGRWLQRMSTGKGSYGWKKYTFVFDTGNQNYFDIRFVIQDRGTVWIDDVYFGKAN